MQREFIEVISSNGEVVDEIPLLTPGRGRGAKIRNEKIKENDKRLRKYIREGYTVRLTAREN